MFYPFVRRIGWLMASSFLLCCIACQNEHEEPVVLEKPAQEPKPTSPAKVDGRCGEDFACFLARAKTCQRARVKTKNGYELLGQKLVQNWDLEIRGMISGKCDFRRTLLGIDISMTDEIKKKMKDKGMTDAQIAETNQLTFEKMKEEGETEEVCSLTIPELTKLLTAEQSGTYDTRNYEGCEKPNLRCSDLPPLAVGCGTGPCMAGKWPITCTDKNGAKDRCYFRGEVSPAVEVSCVGGKTQFKTQ
jgi:hypothetical protein